MAMAVALWLAGGARGAAAQMNTPEWIQDVNWHVNLGTGVALETGPDPMPGDTQQRDPFLLYFGGDVRKSWRWWYGLTFQAKAMLLADLADYPMLPYRIEGYGGLGMGPPVFRMEVIHAWVRSEPFGWVNDRQFYSTGTIFRIVGSTLPTFTGDVPLPGDQHLLSYFVAPLQINFGFYDTTVQPGIHDGQVAHVPYTSGGLRVEDRVTLTPWAQLVGAIELQKAWSNEEFRFVVDFSAIIGILENAVQFSLDVRHDHWKTPGGYTENHATFVLAARLRI
ncbi:MAG: hypothetical protein D6729_12575 [Deltaproteobacteria bacterium]|nr:MAG: hypothetical protein D6729_12575 [Deltaproteobacteria bacterium]